MPAKSSPLESTLVLFGWIRNTVYGVLRALEIIPEASRRLPNDRHPKIDWAAIAAAGNVYRHVYEVVDETLIWQTVQYGLAALRAAAREVFLRFRVAVVAHLKPAAQAMYTSLVAYCAGGTFRGCRRRPSPGNHNFGKGYLFRSVSVLANRDCLADS